MAEDGSLERRGMQAEIESKQREKINHHRGGGLTEVVVIVIIIRARFTATKLTSPRGLADSP